MSTTNPPTRMGLLQTLRKIRACEGEAAAQLVLEAFVAQEVAAERERCARVCDDEARIRTEAANKHGDDTPEQGRCLAAARAAINCAKGCRYGEQV